VSLHSLWFFMGYTDLLVADVKAETDSADELKPSDNAAMAEADAEEEV
jgi:hypothetical protein